jgi:hypothetical protein
MRALLLLALAGVAVAGCGADRSDDAARVAEGFYAAVAEEDGRRACRQLTPGTASQLEKDEGKPCEEAVLALSLSGERAAGSAVYVTAAKVDLDAGDSVFLDEAPGGWRIAAAGCRPQPGEEAPYDCELDS